MRNNSDLAFNNFIMTQGLEELLKLISNEKDKSKIAQIKKVIHLRVNYIDDNNQRLQGLSLYRHKKNIRKRYKGTPQIKYITFNSNFRRNILILGVLLMGIISGRIYYEYSNNLEKIERYVLNDLRNFHFKEENVLEDMKKGNIIDIVNDNYTYKGAKLTKEKLDALYRIRLALGKKYLEKDEFEESETNFLEAQEIANIVDEREKIFKVEQGLKGLEERVNFYIAEKIESLGESIDDEEIRKNGNSIIKLAKRFSIPEVEKRVFEKSGDISLERFSLLTARNYYLLTKKFSKEEEGIENKIKNVEIMMKINSLLQEIKILQVDENPALVESINRKYDEIIDLNESLDKNYKVLEI